MRKQADSFTLDDEARAHLRTLAERETNGNLSEMVRRLIHDAAQRAGITQEVHA